MRREQLDAGVRTVTHVAVYFGELKIKAAELASRILPQTRGYFTPDEEAETSGLLVSYWQARNALFDLITSYRHDDDLSDEDRPDAFLTAFAAALILVDAARFLRSVAHDRPAVKDKLNQPFAEFQIPAGVYDHVQRSLLGARHAWHLYFAAQYFREHEAELRERARGGPLAPVVAIIDALRGQLDVSAATYAQARLRMRAGQLAMSVGRGLLWRALYGIQKLGGTLVADRYVKRGHRPGLPTDVASQLAGALMPGDVLVVRKEFALTNYFLPGYWPHAALYLGNPESLATLGIYDHPDVRPRWARLLDHSLGRSPHRVLESMKDGVHIRPLDSPFASDSVVVLRPQLELPQIAAALVRAIAHEGKPYDFDFDFRRSDRLVCTEVIYRAYDGLAAIRLPLISRAGRPTLAGRDLIALGAQRNGFSPAAVYAPRLCDGIAAGDQAVELLRIGEGKIENAE